MSVTAKIRFERPDFVLDAELALPAQSISVVFGVSGSGKTTLLRSLAGLESHTDNRIEVGGSVWQDNKRTIPTHLRKVGFVFQESRLFPHLKVAGNVRYGMKRNGQDPSGKYFERITRILDITDLLDRFPESLSGGEQQRVAIARALAIKPELLLLDEPLASLDLASKQKILPFISRIRNELKIPVIYVTHSLDEVVRIADWLILLDSGRVVAAGPVNEILTNPDIPLMFRYDASSVLEATVQERDIEHHLDFLTGDGYSLWVQSSDQPIGSAIRLSIAARDVSVTLSHAQDTSILNILPAVVESLSPDGESRTLVVLRIGSQLILARITSRSATLLKLEPGLAVFAQIKGVAVIS
ncbi:MAG: molybdenum ABC transporter ATP-binding protein [Bacteroidetes bacterium]|nr:MAG: molybdenum ABC transporter ATP-binding protein [Bacteroidota bacterium]